MKSICRTPTRCAKRARPPLSEPRCRTLQVDLSAVTFLDSSGVGALVGLRNAALNKGGSLVLVSPQPPVRRVLELTTMDKVFDIHEE